MKEKIKAKILVAEDGEDNQILLSHLLKHLGADAVIVDNGQKALDRALEEEFDLLFLDMQMPILDGYKVASKLRDENYKTPIVALTANAMDGTKEKCIDAGCDDYLSKPFSRRDFQLLLDKWINH